MYCEYYQAQTCKEKTWFLSACIRNEENIAFARAIEGCSTTFEFFVPKDQEQQFLNLMKKLLEMGIILNLEKKPNRIKAFLNAA